MGRGRVLTGDRTRVLTRFCERCGKPYRRPSSLQNPRNRYCSPQCYWDEIFSPRPLDPPPDWRDSRLEDTVGSLAEYLGIHPVKHHEDSQATENRDAHDA